jgi:hypothetical protein
MASRISVSLRLTVFSRVRKKLRATCMVMVLPPWVARRPGDGIGGAGEADEVDALVLEEAAVLGGDEGVDQSSGGMSSKATARRRCTPNSAISEPSAV